MMIEVTMDQFEELQAGICIKYGADLCVTPENGMIALSKTFSKSAVPINGLRHPLEGTMSGWFIWSGELSVVEYSFEPVHATHLEQIYPTLIKYIGLAPGWRFLFDENYGDEGYEDV